MTAYKQAKKSINTKTFDEATITKRMNTFYMFNQMSEGEYEELMQLIGTNYKPAM